MNFTDVLKIAFYLVVLFVAIVVLKTLSNFEYDLRDKNIKYEELWSAEFDNSLGSNLFRKPEQPGITYEGGWLLLELSKALADDGFYVFDNFKFGVADTGYIEIRYEVHTDIDDSTSPCLSWLGNKREEHKLIALDSVQRGPQIFKSEMMPLSRVGELVMSVDTLIEPAAITGIVHIDYIKFVKEIRQQKVF